MIDALIVIIVVCTLVYICVVVIENRPIRRRKN